jgi:hypothetical protein
MCQKEGFVVKHAAVAILFVFFATAYGQQSDDICTVVTEHEHEVFDGDLLRAFTFEIGNMRYYACAAISVVGLQQLADTVEATVAYAKPLLHSSGYSMMPIKLVQDDMVIQLTHPNRERMFDVIESGALWVNRDTGQHYMYATLMGNDEFGRMIGFVILVLSN